MEPKAMLTSTYLLLIITIISCSGVASQTPDPPTNFGLPALLNQTDSPNSAVALYKEPNGWLLKILRIFFNDIDWPVIEAAREQVVKFVTRVERLVSGASDRSNVNRQGTGRVLASRNWWKPDTSKVDPLGMSEASNVKDMLQKVACFVGYMRILNQANEALAELDASKVVSNLFSSSGKAAASGGYFSKWIG